MVISMKILVCTLLISIMPLLGLSQERLPVNDMHLYSYSDTNYPGSILSPANDSLLSDVNDPNPEFEQFLDRLDKSIFQFVNGDDAAFKQVWSHAEDITVAGGFGGEIAQGWETINPRLSQVSASYSNTLYSTQRISKQSAGNFGYLVQHEYFHRNGETEPYRQYRTTMLFRLESGEWKLFHRHADAQVVFQARD
jgi:ketosteroid isomerase-like protein